MASKIVHVISEANSNPTMTAFTTTSAERNIDIGDSSCRPTTDLEGVPSLVATGSSGVRDDASGTMGVVAAVGAGMTSGAGADELDAGEGGTDAEGAMALAAALAGATGTLC